MAAMLLASFTVVAGYWTSRATPGLDFYQVWAAAHAVRQQVVTDIYADPDCPAMRVAFIESPRESAASVRQRRAAAGTNSLGINSTPFMYAVLAPFVTDDYDRDFERYQLVASACGWIGVVVLARLIGLEWLATLLIVALLGQWFEPFLAELAVANVNRIQLGLLAAYLLLRRVGRSVAAELGAGAVLGAGLLFKPNLGFVALLLATSWVVGARWCTLVSHAIGATLGAAAAILYAAGFFGSFGCWITWRQRIADVVAGLDCPVTMGNFALSELLRSAVGVSIPWLGAIVPVTAVAIVLVLERVRPDASAGLFFVSERADEAQFRREVILVAIGAAVWVLSAGLAWSHYYVLMVPAMLYVVRSDPRSDGVLARLSLPYRAAAVAAWLMLSSLPSSLMDASPLVRSALLNSASTLLLLLLLRDLLKVREAIPAAPDR